MTTKEKMVGTRLPDNIVLEIEKIERIEGIDRSTVLRKLLYGALKDWKLDYYAREYGEGRITMGKASEEAGVSLWEMMEYVRQKRMPSQYSLEDLEHDLRIISKSNQTLRSSVK